MTDFNFVYFGVSNDFYRHSFADLNKEESVIVREDLFESKMKFLYYLYRIHTFPRIRICFPFSKIWDRFCFHDKIENGKQYCFVFMPKHANRHSYFKYLRSKYPNCKLVMMFRDLVSRNLKWFPNLNIEELKKEFDIVYSYNKFDCEKYGFLYFNTESSKENLIANEKNKWSDIVFVGNAKGRAERLISIYKKCQKLGLKTDFYIVNVPKKLRFVGDGIVFADKGITYSQMLEKEINSKCILEISQTGEYGFTSRSQEALMYNKKLITDSLIVRDQPFYPSNSILFYNDIEDINFDLLKDSHEIDYHYHDEYSPITLLHKIEKDINSLNN